MVFESFFSTKIDSELSKKIKLEFSFQKYQAILKNPTIEEFLKQFPISLMGVEYHDVAGTVKVKDKEVHVNLKSRFFIVKEHNEKYCLPWDVDIHLIISPKEIKFKKLILNPKDLRENIIKDRREFLTFVRFNYKPKPTLGFYHARLKSNQDEKEALKKEVIEFFIQNPEDLVSLQDADQFLDGVLSKMRMLETHKTKSTPMFIYGAIKDALGHFVAKPELYKSVNKSYSDYLKNNIAAFFTKHIGQEIILELAKDKKFVEQMQDLGQPIISLMLKDKDFRSEYMSHYVQKENHEVTRYANFLVEYNAYQEEKDPEVQKLRLQAIRSKYKKESLSDLDNLVMKAEKVLLEKTQLTAFSPNMTRKVN